MRRDALSDRNPKTHIRVNKGTLLYIEQGFHPRAKVGENLRQSFIMLGLVDHLPQATDVEPPSLLALSHILKMSHCTIGTFFDVLVESATGDVVLARFGGPIAPSLERLSLPAVAVPASIALLFGITLADFDGPSADGCAQGGEGIVCGVAIGEFDEAVPWVSPADRVDRYMDLFQTAEAIRGEGFFYVVGPGRVGQVTCARQSA